MKWLKAMVLFLVFSATGVFSAPPTSEVVPVAKEYKVDGFLVTAPELGVEDPLVNVQSGWEVHNPITKTQKNVPPLSGVHPVDPIFIDIRGMPGLNYQKTYPNELGKTSLMMDNIIVKQTKLADGKITIPAGGIVYDSGYMGADAYMGNQRLLPDGKVAYVINRDVGITVASNVVLKLGVPVTIGDNVFRYMGSPGMGDMSQANIYIYTKEGMEWTHAGESPVGLPIGPKKTETGLEGGKAGWYGRPEQAKLPVGKVAAMGDFNQIFAWQKDVTATEIKATTIYSMDEWASTLALTKVFRGKVKAGQTIQAGDATVRVAAIDNTAGTVSVEILKGTAVASKKTLGFISAKERAEAVAAFPNSDLISDRMILEDRTNSVAVYLWPFTAVANGEAELIVYKDLLYFEDGKPIPMDANYIWDGTNCPQGHNHGFMMYNKDPIVLDANNRVTNGPAGYFKIVIDKISGDTVQFHLEDKAGAKSAVVEKKGNIDFMAGSGWAVSTTSWLTGAKVLEATYGQVDRLNKQVVELQEQLSKALQAAPPAPAATPAPARGVCGPSVIALLAVLPAVLYAARRRMG